MERGWKEGRNSQQQQQQQHPSPALGDMVWSRRRGQMEQLLLLLRKKP